jgi:hypothetical protein
MRPFARLTLVATFAALAGCSTMKSITDTKSTPEISRLTVTPRRLHPGQNGLAMTQTRNAPSTDYKIVFTATLGTVKPSPDGTSATFTAGPDAGNAIITAQLVGKDGTSVSQQEAKVLILPVR